MKPIEYPSSQPRNQAELAVFVDSIRQQLEPIWERDPDRAGWPDDPLSAYQCVRSLPYILDGLTRVDATILTYNGILSCVSGAAGNPLDDPLPVNPHSWLSVKYADEATITVDITADQHPNIELDVVCHTAEELAAAGLAYGVGRTWRREYVGNKWLYKPGSEPPAEYIRLLVF